MHKFEGHIQTFMGCSAKNSHHLKEHLPCASPSSPKSTMNTQKPQVQTVPGEYFSHDSVINTWEIMGGLAWILKRVIL